MNYVDIGLLIVLGGFVLYGFWFGLIHMIGSVAGLLVGAFLSARFYAVGADWLGMVGNPNLAKVLSFVIIFVVTTKMIGLLFWFVDKTMRFLAVIPFMMTFNRLLGAVLGFAEGLLALGFTVWFVGRYPVTQAFAEMMTGSIVAQILNVIGSILALLAPTALRAAQSIF